MERHTKIILATILIFGLSTGLAYADSPFVTTLVNSLKEKITALVTPNVTQANSDLDSAAANFEHDINAYNQQYLQDISSNLSQYSQDYTRQKIQELESYKNQYQQELDSQKLQILADLEKQIQSDIDKKYSEVESDLLKKLK